ncbi:MAG: amidase domain-containing protein [Eubacteriales bacterium]|nr:amidase domain-containing protein [Eubacteriales bacterium]
MKERKQKMNTLLKISLCGLIITLTMTTGIYANARTLEKNVHEGANIQNVSDAEAWLESYFEKNGINIEIGTPEYVDYLTDILVFENDKTMKKEKEYDDIKLYASEYLSCLNGPDMIVDEEKEKMMLNTEEQEKSLVQIEKEATKESVETENKNSNLYKVSVASAANKYSDSNAVKYAKKWAKKRNPRYKSYSSDCTNFVSQCVNAGGKKMNTPKSIPEGVKSSTNYWYSLRYQEWHANNYIYRWRETTSFIRVSDFFTYWEKKGIKKANYSSKTKLQNGVAVGDVVQLKNGNGKWFHTIIITGGSKGNRKYCGHSSNRLDEPVKNISGAVSYRVLKF